MSGQSTMFVHSVLFAEPSPEAARDRGPIDQSGAVALLRSFPFGAELRKRVDRPDLTVPSLTFNVVGSESSLTIWSAELGQFRIWVPEIFGMVDGITDIDDVADCVELFFEADIETLGIRLIRMEEKYA